MLVVQQKTANGTLAGHSGLKVNHRTAGNINLLLLTNLQYSQNAEFRET